MRFFIIGIAGRTGLRIAKRLTDLGDVVSGLYRKPAQLTSISRTGADGVLGDIATITISELSTLLEGYDGVVFTAGAGDQDDEAMIDALDEGGVRKAIAAAVTAHASRFLLISVFPEAWRERKLGEPFEHYMCAKKKADIALVRSDLDWIVLRPSALEDDAGLGRVSLGLAELHETITRDDLAATVVAILHTPAVTKRILEVTAGDTAIDDAVHALIGT